MVILPNGHFGLDAAQHVVMVLGLGLEIVPTQLLAKVEKIVQEGDWMFRIVKRIKLVLVSEALNEMYLSKIWYRRPHVFHCLQRSWSVTQEVMHLIQGVSEVYSWKK